MPNTDTQGNIVHLSGVGLGKQALYTNEMSLIVGSGANGI